jgi:CubicO group peptidase (beta-lactamase class C family)
MNIYKIYLKIILIIIWFFSCQSDPSGPSGSDYTYQIPNQTDDGWETASLSAAGMNEANLVNMMNYINNIDNHRIHNVIIIKDYKLVFEEYFSGHLFDTDQIGSEGPYITYARDTLHFMASVTKSVTSVVFGIAMDQGLAANTDVKLLQFYPEYSSILTGQKADINLQHLLTMTAGLAWDESTYSFGDSRNDVTGMFSAGNPIPFILAKPLESIPGQRFHYNSGYANILADLVRLKMKSNFKFFADVRLFGPLNITNYRWDLISKDYVFASGGLYLKPRDLAKIGQLYLNEGSWNGNNLISPGWINASIENFVNPGWTNFSNGYGYQWWLWTFNAGEKSYNCFMAVGWGEQLMYVFPTEKLVIVMNCGYFYSSPPFPLHSLVQNYILESLM